MRQPHARLAIISLALSCHSSAVRQTPNELLPPNETHLDPHIDCSNTEPVVRWLFSRASEAFEPKQYIDRASFIVKSALYDCKDDENAWYVAARISELGLISYPLRLENEKINNARALIEMATNKFPSSPKIVGVYTRVTGDTSLLQPMYDKNPKDSALAYSLASAIFERTEQKSKTWSALTMLENAEALESVPGGTALLAQIKYQMKDYFGAATTAIRMEQPIELLQEPTDYHTYIAIQRSRFQVRAKAELALGHEAIANTFFVAARQDATPEQVNLAERYDLDKGYPDLAGNFSDENSDGDDADLTLLGANSHWLPVSHLNTSQPFQLENVSYNPIQFDLSMESGTTEDNYQQIIPNGKPCRDKLKEQHDLLGKSLADKATFRGEHPNLAMPLVGRLTAIREGGVSIPVQGGTPFTCKETPQDRHTWSFTTPTGITLPKGRMVEYFRLGKPVAYSTAGWPKSRLPWGTPLKRDPDDTVYYSRDHKTWINASGVNNRGRPWAEICRSRWNPNTMPGIGYFSKKGLCEEWNTLLASEMADATSPHRKKPQASEIDIPKSVLERVKAIVNLKYFFFPVKVDGKTSFVFFDEYRTNDFGKIAFPLLLPNGKRSGLLMHSTDDGELKDAILQDSLRARGMPEDMIISQRQAQSKESKPIYNATAVYSHGCVHVTPSDRDSWIKLGYLREGALLRILPYQQVGKAPPPVTASLVMNESPNN